MFIVGSSIEVTHGGICLIITNVDKAITLKCVIKMYFWTLRHLCF